MTIYYVTACFEYEGDWSEGAKAFMSIESAEAHKAFLESERYGDWVEIREMAVEA
jgi:uncharacterized protein (DUF1330 family)